MKVGEEFLKEFKRSYHQNGKFDLESQVPYLAHLAEHYKHKYVAERDWRDCLKVRNFFLPENLISGQYMMYMIDWLMHTIYI